MEPQDHKTKKQAQEAFHQKTLSENAASSPAPMTVKGQRYVSPEGRHSQQTHRIAEERAAAAGHASEKEQHAHDREATITGITDSAAEKIQHQQRSAPK